MIRPTSTLKGEKLKEKEVRAIMCMGKWGLKGKGQGKRPNPFFFLGGPKDAGQREKKGDNWRGLER